MKMRSVQIDTGRALPAHCIRFCFLFAFFVFLFSFYSKAQCLTSATVDAGVVVNDNSVGTLAFSNPGNGRVENNNRAAAAATLSILSGNTYYLKATSFGFAIPPTASICGVAVEVRKRAGGLGIGAWIQDNDIRLIKGGAVAGNNSANLGVDWSGTDTYATHGGSNQLWGTTLTPADVNASDFGVVVSAKFNGLALVLPSAQIDNIRMTIYYTPILPTRIISFDAIAKNGGIYLEWETADEEDNESVTLQRLSPGQSQWQDIAYYEMKTGNNNHHYSYDDFPGGKGNYSYRLKITGASEQSTYSKINNVRLGGSAAISLYPNPSSDYIIIEGVANGDRILIMDQLGQSLTPPAQQLGNNKVKIDLARLPKGAYVASTGQEKIKFIRY